MKIQELMGRTEIPEGMDNSFFLSRDLPGGPTIYPLPTDATEYELAEDGTWYHGTPELQKLGDNFESRTESVDYITDPKKWMQIQQELEKYPSGSDPYMDLLDAAAALRTRKTIRKPIFLSDRQDVAGTYADDRRAFDYQAAVPGVVEVDVAPGKTLEISGAGQNFRGIKVASLKNALVQDGMDEMSVKRLIDQFTHQIRGDGGTLSTTSLAAIVDELGYDIIDVHMIKDNYRGDGPMATVRMVMDPSLIRIRRK